MYFNRIIAEVTCARLLSLHPSVRTAEFRENSEFDVIIPDVIETSPAPAYHYLRILREEMDPAGIVLGK